MKVVFILGSLHMQRCMKRIDEFVDNGFDVDAYGFDCGVAAKTYPKSVLIQVLGKMDLSWGYRKRIQPLYNGIRKVVKRYNKKDTIFYIFGLDKTILFQLFKNRRYIYEESDLVHTYMGNKLVVALFESLDKYVIKHSLLSVFTSEGFIRYHFGHIQPPNTYVIANRLPLSVKALPTVEKKPFDINHLSIGFVGFIRFKSIFNFAKVIGCNCPNITFHFFGTANNVADEKLFAPLHQYENIIFHGAFKHPHDLPSVYSQIDLVLSTYDVENENVRYAEPNKIYEAIWYKTPIIVSSGTYLADKVKSLDIGYDINPLDNKTIIDFVDSLTEDSIKMKRDAIDKLDSNIALNKNDDFFQILETLEKNKE